MRPAFIAAAVLAITLVAPSFSIGAIPNTRLSNDNSTGNYISLYTQNTGVAYDDSVLKECRIARGRQNEPSDAMDPRNANLILGSSNDYCGVYQPFGATVQQPVGPIWLGYYRSENGGTTFQSTLVPGYPGDTSPYAALAHIRTASSGDPVIAWDNHGRAFFGSESSDDPAPTVQSLSSFGGGGGSSRGSSVPEIQRRPLARSSSRSARRSSVGSGSSRRRSERSDPPGV